MGQLPIANGFYESKSLPISNQQCVNWYPSIVEAPGLSDRVLFGIPGINLLTSTGLVQENNRGGWKKNGIPYFVNGGTLYRLDRVINEGEEIFSTIALGLIEGENRVSMADNGLQLMILVPGGKGYIYNEDEGTPFQEIVDPDFTANGAPQYVQYIDGYFAVTTDSKKWIVSALNNGMAWDALDFSSAESDPDVIVAPVVISNQIYITGSVTAEGYQNIGGVGFPFQRNNVFLDKGCFAPFSLVTTNNTFYMVGGGKDESPAVWVFTGNNFDKVSTDAIDSILSTYTDIQLNDTYGWSYAQDGAYFIGFTFPDRSFVYDITTKQWHERKSQIRDVATRWRINALVTAYGRVIVGDAFSGRLGELHPKFYQEYGIDIVRIVSTMPFAQNSKPVLIPKIELTVESGVGNEDVEDPQISMSISKDGKKWNYERNRSIGKIGKTNQKLIWRKNGWCSRFAVLLFRLSDPVKPVIIKLEAE